MRPTFEQIVLHWKDRCGLIPINSENRIEALLDLFTALVHHGYTKEDIEMNPNKGIIIYHCHNPNHKNQTKKKIWQDMIKTDLQMAILRMWEIDMPTYDKNASNFKKVEFTPPPERPRYEPKPEDSSQESTEDSGSVGIPFTPEEISAMKSNAPKPIYDKELSELLGFNDE